MTVESDDAIAIATLENLVTVFLANDPETKPKPVAHCTRDFFRAWSKLHVIATSNSDWSIALFGNHLKFPQNLNFMQ